MTPLQISRLASPSARRSRWTARIAFVASSLMLAACSPIVIDSKGVIGQNDRTILLDSLAIMLAIIVPTILATVAFAWWYRASNRKAKYLPDWEFSGRIEIVVWAIPTMTIILLGGVTWIGAHELDPAKPIESTSAALEVQVVSLDWKWLFIYPEQRVASVNELVVPAGVPVHFSLTSSSVMNTFFVPQLGSMIYTMNGMATQLWLQADHAGVYYGQSGHYSGEGFSDMHFPMRSVSATDFARWVNRTREAGPTLDAASYDVLARQSINVPATTYAAVEKNLFDDIVSQKLQPGPGPDTERNGAAAKPEIKP